tara:strand:- start:30 stop:377 length:348 start_codon:yes stop_codon:yes gene_type:complete
MTSKIGRILEHTVLDPEPGDVRITQHMDREGQMCYAGRHTNLGYSGRIFVFIYDGQNWAWLRNKDKPDLPRGYEYQHQAEKLIEEYTEHYEGMPSETEFNFWWWKGKRFAKIANN